jgi:cellulase
MVARLSILLVLVSKISAHGHVTGIVANGKYFMGYTPNFQYMNPVPKVPAWNAGGYGQGGIVADQYANVSLSFDLVFRLAML